MVLFWDIFDLIIFSSLSLENINKIFEIIIHIYNKVKWSGGGGYHKICLITFNIFFGLNTEIYNFEVTESVITITGA